MGGERGGRVVRGCCLFDQLETERGELDCGPAGNWLEHPPDPKAAVQEESHGPAEVVGQAVRHLEA